MFPHQQPLQAAGQPSCTHGPMHPCPDCLQGITLCLQIAQEDLTLLQTHYQYLSAEFFGFSQAVLTSQTIPLTTRQVCNGAFIVGPYTNAAPPPRARLQNLETLLQSATHAFQRQDIAAVLPMIGTMTAEIGALTDCLADLASKLRMFRDLAKDAAAGPSTLDTISSQVVHQATLHDVQTPTVEPQQESKRPRGTRGGGKPIRRPVQDASGAAEDQDSDTR